MATEFWSTEVKKQIRNQAETMVQRIPADNQFYQVIFYEDRDEILGFRGVPLGTGEVFESDTVRKLADWAQLQ